MMVRGSTDAILVRRDVLSRTDCRRLIAEFRRIALLSGMPDVRRLPARVEITGAVLRGFASPDVSATLTRLRERARDELCRFYHVRRPCYIDFTLVTEMQKGDSHNLHADNARPGPNGRWIPNHTPWRSYTAITYLADSGTAFTGGALSFPGIERRVIPKAGLMVGFPCGHVHKHAVTLVERGRRYAISVWLTHDPAHEETWA